MGNVGGKGRRCDPDSDIMTDMKKRYEDKSCVFLNYWYDKHGFPEGGFVEQS